MVLKGSSEQNNNEELGEGAFVQGGAGWVKGCCLWAWSPSAEGEQCQGALGQHCCGVLWPWCCSPPVQGFTCLPHPTLCHPGPPCPISWGLLTQYFKLTALLPPGSRLRVITSFYYRFCSNSFLIRLSPAARPGQALLPRRRLAAGAEAGLGHRVCSGGLGRTGMAPRPSLWPSGAGVPFCSCP